MKAIFGDPLANPAVARLFRGHPGGVVGDVRDGDGHGPRPDRAAGGWARRGHAPDGSRAWTCICRWREFGPLFAMWAIMMAAMMLPTLVPTLARLRRPDDQCDGHPRRAGLACCWAISMVWVAFAALITGVQLALLFGGVVDMLGIAKSTVFRGSPAAGGGGIPIHPRQRNLPRCLPQPDDLFPGPLARGLCRGAAHGAWPWRVLRRLLLGLYGAWFRRRRDEPIVDGPGHAFHGARKTAADRSPGDETDGRGADIRRAWPCWPMPLANGG